MVHAGVYRKTITNNYTKLNFQFIHDRNLTLSTNFEFARTSQIQREIFGLPCWYKNGHNTDKAIHNMCKQMYDIRHVSSQ